MANLRYQLIDNTKWPNQLLVQLLHTKWSIVCSVANAFISSSEQSWVSCEVLRKHFTFKMHYCGWKITFRASGKRQNFNLFPPSVLYHWVIVSLWLSGRASEREIRRSLRFDSSWELRIFSLSHARNKTKNIFLDVVFCLSYKHNSTSLTRKVDLMNKWK